MNWISCWLPILYLPQQAFVLLEPFGVPSLGERGQWPDYPAGKLDLSDGLHLRAGTALPHHRPLGFADGREKAFGLADDREGVIIGCPAKRFPGVLYGLHLFAMDLEGPLLQVDRAESGQ